jgi:hypothetical protein
MSKNSKLKNNKRTRWPSLDPQPPLLPTPCFLPTKFTLASNVATFYFSRDPLLHPHSHLRWNWQKNAMTLLRSQAASVANSKFSLTEFTLASNVTTLCFSRDPLPHPHSHLRRNWQKNRMTLASLAKCWGQTHSLIFGQCSQLLKDKMKQDADWTAGSVSYNPLTLCQLIEKTVLAQIEDQQPFDNLWFSTHPIIHPSQIHLASHNIGAFY